MSSEADVWELKSCISEIATRLRREAMENALIEMKYLAQQVGAAWCSPKSGVELVSEQRR